MLKNKYWTCTYFLSTICLLLCSNMVFAQKIGGQGIYKFLWNPSSARITALGGNCIATRDDDAVLAIQNPSLLNEAGSENISFNHRFYYAGLQDGCFTYAHTYAPWKTNFHAAAQYASYGEFTQANEYGAITGNFKAADYAFILGASHNLYENLSLGVNLKYISSRLENYGSTGIATDFGATYFNPEKNITFTMLFRNVGTQLSNYYETKENLPYELQLGMSKRLKHLPFRFSIIYANFQRWNVLYDDPNQVDDAVLIGDNTSTKQSSTSLYFDNLFRHFIFNGEFYIGKKENFRLRLGYNHQLKKELSVANYRSLAGFSGGFGFKINRFRLDYGTAVYHLVGRTHHLSLSTNINSFRK